MEEAAPAEGKVYDLMEALEASLAAAKKGSTAKKTSTAKKAPARKSTAARPRRKSA
ncbi:MAG TPA: hypothetical protein VF244_02180 [Acidimicrobiales bacterium]